MRLRTWKTMLGITMGLAMALTVAWKAGASPQFGNFQIEGTWLVTVTQKNCSTGVTLSSFPSILTFADGGTMAEDTMNHAFAVGQRSAGQGYWRYEGGGSFQAKSIAFINYPTPTPYAPGAPIFKAGTQTITQTIQFTYGQPDKWSTTKAAVEFLDSTGTPYAPSPVAACVSATGVRFE